MANKKQSAKRGFAVMSVEERRVVASKGGRAAHERGVAHEFTPEEARKAGKKGGRKSHMNDDMNDYGDYGNY